MKKNSIKKIGIFCLSLISGLAYASAAKRVLVVKPKKIEEKDPLLAKAIIASMVDDAVRSQAQLADEEEFQTAMALSLVEAKMQEENAAKELMVKKAQAIKLETSDPEMVASFRQALLGFIDTYLKNTSVENLQALSHLFIQSAQTAGVFHDDRFKQALARRLIGLEKAEFLASLDKKQRERIDILCRYFKKIIDGTFGTVEKSFIDPKGQYEYSDTEVTACAAFATRAASELKAAGSLEELYKKNKGTLVELITDGGILYLSAAKNIKGEYLDVGQVHKSEHFPKNIQFVEQSDLSPVIIAELSDPLVPLKRVLDALERYAYAAAPKQQAAAAAAVAEAPVAAEARVIYALVTFSHQTIMISFNPHTGHWILFDSHRANKYTNTGAGFHEFSSRENLMTYLVAYQGLDTEIQKDYELFS